MTEEQAAMMSRARGSLQLALTAQEQGQHNEAVSSAYYAMFHAANAALAGIGLGFSKHSAVVAAFGREFARTGVLPRELHSWLGDAFDARQAATYEYDVQLRPEDAEPFLDEAEHFIAAIEQYLTGRER